MIRKKLYNKKTLLFFIFLSILSCQERADKSPLVVPPNFSELPDLKNPEQITPQQKEENIAKLKELLLKNEE